MAQRRSKHKSKPKVDLSRIVQIRPRRKSAGNDNEKTRFSGLKFKEARQLKRRIDDVEWQIRFAKMKLHHWQDVDNWAWDPLKTLLKRAKAARQHLS